MDNQGQKFYKIKNLLDSPKIDNSVVKICDMNETVHDLIATENAVIALDDKQVRKLKRLFKGTTCEIEIYVELEDDDE